MQHNYPVLFVGPTGTSKTVTIKQSLARMDQATTVPILINFSAQTSENQVQGILDSKVLFFAGYVAHMI